LNNVFAAIAGDNRSELLKLLPYIEQQLELKARFVAFLAQNDLQHLARRTTAIKDLLQPFLREAGVEVEQGGNKKMQQTEEVYIQNSGLVLLAPFLKPFFGALNFLEGDGFKNEQIQHRAAWLLNYLVFKTKETQEFQLPLCKLLCNIPQTDAPYLVDELTVEEQEECEKLLLAVIRNAPILKNMQPDGFRTTFLIRNGKISMRDKSWLLQVEHKTYDIVLSKFPWAFGMIKLPWMDKLLVTEWQTA